MKEQKMVCNGKGHANREIFIVELERRNVEGEMKDINLQEMAST
jgi:hypothetical protein